MTDIQFEQTRKALQSKQRDLKRKGKGNKPNASDALSDEHIQVLYERHLLGSSTAEALLNTVWFNNTIQVYGEKRPAEMKTDDAPLYLAVNNVNLAPANLSSKKLQSV